MQLASKGVLVTRLSASEDAATHGRPLRGQDRHDHGQPAGRHGRDPADGPERGRGAAVGRWPPRRRTRTPSTWPSSPRPQAAGLLGTGFRQESFTPFDPQNAPHRGAWSSCTGSDDPRDEGSGQRPSRRPATWRDEAVRRRCSSRPRALAKAAARTLAVASSRGAGPAAARRAGDPVATRPGRIRRR